MKFSDEEFARLVQEAIKGLPDFAHEYLENVVVDIEPAPSARECREMGIDDPGELLGLYVGVPLTERSIEEMPIGPDRVIIYKRNIEQICETRDDVVEEVRTTVLHEIGHHFGLDEDDLEEMGFD